MPSLKTIHDCIDRIKSKHFPGRPIAKAKVLAAFKRLPWPVPDDLRLFYEHCNGARLFDQDDPPFEIVPIQQFHSTRIDITGEDDDNWAPAAWYSIAHVQDGNYIAIDLSSQSGKSADILDCFHETLGVEGYQQIIAKSFTNFLCKALSSKGRHFWFDDDFAGYGYR